MTTIITKNGSGAPTAGQLTTGELAVDLTNKELYTKDSGGNVIKVGAQGGSTGTFTDLTATSSFTSPGIDDNATSTAITIDANENVTVGGTTAGNAGTINVSVGSPGSTIGGLQLWAGTSGAHFMQFGDTASGDGYYRGAVGYLHASDALVAYSAGTERMRITSSGDVNINGTGSNLLTASGRGILSIDGTSDSGMEFKAGGTTYGYLYASSGEQRLVAYTAIPLTFFTSNTERMRIDASGDVMVGNTSSYLSAANRRVLQATGSTDGSILSLQGTSGDFYIHSGSGNTANVNVVNRANGYMNFFTNNTERLRIAADGSVGIGTTSPAGKQHTVLATSHTWGAAWSVGTAVFGGAGSTSGALGISYNDTDGAVLGAIAPGVAWKPVALYGSELSFSIAGSNEAMRIDSLGNVGIGTGSGSILAPLHVKGASPDGVAGYLRLQNQTSSTGYTGVYFGADATYAKQAIYARRSQPNGGGSLIFAVDSNFDAADVAISDEKMRLDASGNLLVGTTQHRPATNNVNGVSTDATYGIEASVTSGGPLTLNRKSTDGGIISLKKDGATVGSIGVATSELYLSSGNTGLYFDDVNNLIRPTNSTGGLRDNTVDLGKSDSRFKDSWFSGSVYSGNLLVGTTSNPSAGKVAIEYARGTSAGMRIKDTVGAGGTGVIADFYNSSNASVGSITHNSSTTSYNPSSDARLKESIRDYDNALADVMKLKPRKYSWKATGAEDNGFIAQELLETPEFANRVNPLSVGDDPMYGVDYMKFVAVLTGAIQEQQAMIKTLQAEVTALKGA